MPARLLKTFVLAAVLLLPRAVLGADEIIVAAVSTHEPVAQPTGLDVEAGVRAGLARLPTGLLLGRPVRLVTLEDNCSQTGGREVAGRLVAQGVQVVIGHVCSSAALTAAPVYAKAGIVMISPGARAAKLTTARAGPTIFRLAVRDDRFGAGVAAFIARQGARPPVAIVHDKSRQATAMADDAERSLRAAGQAPVLRDSYVAGERAYHALTRRIAASGAHVVVMPAQPIEAGIMLAELEAAGAMPTLIGSEILAVPDGTDAAQRYGARYLALLPAPLVPVQGPDGRTISDIAARAQAALEAWADAVSRANSTDARQVAGALESAAALTILGAIRFDAHGDVVDGVLVPHVWQRGAWRPLTTEN